jgi:hypothetical protein
LLRPVTPGGLGHGGCGNRQANEDRAKSCLHQVVLHSESLRECTSEPGGPHAAMRPSTHPPRASRTPSWVEAEGHPVTGGRRAEMTLVRQGVANMILRLGRQGHEVGSVGTRPPAPILPISRAVLRMQFTRRLPSRCDIRPVTSILLRAACRIAQMARLGVLAQRLDELGDLGTLLPLSGGTLTLTVDGLRVLALRRASSSPGRRKGRSPCRTLGMETASWMARSTRDGLPSCKKTTKLVYSR